MVEMEGYGSTAPGYSKKMTAKEALDWTWNEWKKRSGPYVTSSLEAYLIMVAFTFVFLFLMIGAIVLIIILGGSLADSSGSSFMIVTLGGFIILFLVLFIVFAVVHSITAAGMMSAIDRTFNGSVCRFGDVFRYGKSSISKYLMIVILNGIFRTVILFVSYLVPITIMVLISMVMPGAVCFGFLLFLLMVIPVMIFVVAPISIQPFVSFIFRYKDKEGRLTSLECVLKAYSFVGKNYGFCRNMGLWVMLFSFLISLIPSVGNIILGIFRFPFVSTAMLYSYYEMVDPSNRPPYENRIDSSQRTMTDQSNDGINLASNAPVGPGMKKCSKCGTVVQSNTTICPNCYSNII